MAPKARSGLPSIWARKAASSGDSVPIAERGVAGKTPGSRATGVLAALVGVNALGGATGPMVSFATGARGSGGGEGFWAVVESFAMGLVETVSPGREG